MRTSYWYCSVDCNRDRRDSAIEKEVRRDKQNQYREGGKEKDRMNGERERERQNKQK